MNTTLETIAAVNESTLKYVTTVQEQVLNAVRQIAAAAPAPEMPQALASWFPQPQPEVIRDIVEETSSFAAKLVEANKSFALGLLGARDAAPVG